MPSITLSLPVNDTIIDATLHANNYAALASLLNGGLDVTNLAASAGITDDRLVSPTSPVYRTIFQAAAFQDGNISNGTYVCCNNEKPQQSGSTGTRGPLFFRLVANDYLVEGKTAKLRLRAQLAINGTALGATCTAGLYPLSSVGGAANVLHATVGSVVSGSTIAFATPSADTISQNATSDFTLPSDGQYVLGFAISGGPTAANNAMSLNLQLQVHNI